MDFEGMRRRRKMFLIRGQREGVVIVKMKDEQRKIRGEGRPVEGRLGLIVLMLAIVVLGVAGSLAWGIAYLHVSPINGVFTIALAAFLVVAGVNLVKEYLAERNAALGRNKDERE